MPRRLRIEFEGAIYQIQCGYPIWAGRRWRRLGHLFLGRYRAEMPNSPCPAATSSTRSGCPVSPPTRPASNWAGICVSGAFARANATQIGLSLISPESFGTLIGADHPISRSTAVTSGPALTFASPSLAEEAARCQNGTVVHRGIANREEAVMSQATIAPPEIKTLADLRERLGGVSLERIWFHPAPGTATEKDVIEAEERENRLCELVDGTLVEKAMGFEEVATGLAARAIDRLVCRPERPGNLRRG